MFRSILTCLAHLNERQIRNHTTDLICSAVCYLTRLAQVKPSYRLATRLPTYSHTHTHTHTHTSPLVYLYVYPPLPPPLLRISVLWWIAIHFSVGFVPRRRFPITVQHLCDPTIWRGSPCTETTSRRASSQRTTSQQLRTGTAAQRFTRSLFNAVQGRGSRAALHAFAF